MKTNTERRPLVVWIATMVGLALVIVFSTPKMVLAQQWTGPDGNNNISNTNTANVGVGATAPTRKFEVQGAAILNGSSRESLVLTDTTTAAAGVGGGIVFAGKYTSGGAIAAQFASINGIKENGTDNNYATAMTFYTRLSGGNPTEQMRISSAGYVGIGTASPSYMLDVAGVIRSSSGGFRFPDGTVQSTAASVFGRTGAVVAATNDYTWAQIDKTTSSLANLTTRSASDLSSGTLPDARFPATLPSASGANLTALNASSLASGTVATTRLGSGTADASTFLRGDNTWAVPSCGSQWTTSGSNINYATAGNVGVGTSTPTSKLHVTGDGRFTGNLTVDGNIAAKYQDVAEWVPASEQMLSGTVVVLDVTKSNQVVRSAQAYDTRVAGVISEQPGIALGESGSGKVLVATTGRVLVNVDATNGPIHIGDLLVTSDVPGMAMKSEPIKVGGRLMHMPGTLIGKALEPLEKGSGKILVLLSLQ